ncbi:hypothetical protein SMICM304S_08363 [Streptomyces microflavus]
MPRYEVAAPSRPPSASPNLPWAVQRDGSGINTPPGFSAAVIAEVASATGLPLTEARDHFEAQGTRTLWRPPASSGRSRSR